LSSLLCYFDDEGSPRFWNWQADGKLVAAARNALPALLDLADEADRLRAVLEAAKELRDEYDNPAPDLGWRAKLRKRLFSAIAAAEGRS